MARRRVVRTFSFTLHIRNKIFAVTRVRHHQRNTSATRNMKKKICLWREEICDRFCVAGSNVHAIERTLRHFSYVTSGSNLIWIHNLDRIDATLHDSCQPLLVSEQHEKLSHLTSFLHECIHESWVEIGFLTRAVKHLFGWHLFTLSSHHRSWFCLKMAEEEFSSFEAELAGGEESRKKSWMEERTFSSIEREKRLLLSRETVEFEFLRPFNL